MIKKLLILTSFLYIYTNLIQFTYSNSNYASCNTVMNKADSVFTKECDINPKIINIHNTYLHGKYQIEVNLDLPKYVIDNRDIITCKNNWLTLSKCEKHTKSISSYTELNWNTNDNIRYYSKNNLESTKKYIELYENKLNQKFSFQYLVPEAKYFKSIPVFPIDKPYKVTQIFGRTEYSNNHTGIDISSSNLNIRSIYSGTVVYSGWDTTSTNCNSGGNIVKIQHENNIFSLYLHLKNLYVKTGDFVKTGQVIGRIGNTGKFNCNSLKEHLHFEIRKSNSYTDTIDPFEIFN